MIVVGIDPSLTGSAVCVWPNTPLRFTSSPAVGVNGRIARFENLASEVVAAVPEGSIVMLEHYSMGSKGSAITDLAEYGGILRSKLLLLTRQVIEVSPHELKRFVTGKGNSDKEVMRAFAERRWHVIHETSDETDAYALARLGLCFSGQEQCDNEVQRSVIEKLKAGPVKKKSRRKHANAG